MLLNITPIRCFNKTKQNVATRSCTNGKMHDNY